MKPTKLQSDRRGRRSARLAKQKISEDKKLKMANEKLLAEIKKLRKENDLLKKKMRNLRQSNGELESELDSK